MMQRYYFFCNHVSFSNGFWVSVLRPPPQGLSVAPGMYETASVTKMEQFKNYRKSFGYMGSIEYYPAKQQDFRLFLAYVGRKYDYSTKCGLKDYNTDRIELGFMYRIKAY